MQHIRYIFYVLSCFYTLSSSLHAFELRGSDTPAGKPGIMIEDTATELSGALSAVSSAQWGSKKTFTVTPLTHAQVAALAHWLSRAHALWVANQSSAGRTLKTELINALDNNKLTHDGLASVITGSDYLDIDMLLQSCTYVAAYKLSWQNLPAYHDLSNYIHVSIAQQFMSNHPKTFFPLLPAPVQFSPHDPLAGEVHKAFEGITLQLGQSEVTGIETQTNKQIFRVPSAGHFGDHVTGARLLHNGKRLLVGLRKRGFEIWDINASTCLLRLQHGITPLGGARLSADENLISVQMDKRFALWQLNDPQFLPILTVDCRLHRYC